jgi:hypothetical protein
MKLKTVAISCALIASIMPADAGILDWFTTPSAFPSRGYYEAFLAGGKKGCLKEIAAVVANSANYDAYCQCYAVAIAGHITRIDLEIAERTKLTPYDYEDRLAMPAHVACVAKAPRQ